MRSIKQNKNYTAPGVAFEAHPNCRAEMVVGAMGTVMNKLQRNRAEKLYVIREFNPDKAEEFAYNSLSEQFPGFFFGLIGKNSNGYLEYGWIPEGASQGV